MDAPPVQYARTSDGVSIAYCVRGAGPPLLYFRIHSHLELDWLVPEFQQWMERLASRWRVIRYDPRGYGLSEDVEEVGARESFSADARAVLDAAEADRALLFRAGGPGSAGGSGSAASLLLAHDLAERWDSVVLWNASLSGPPATLRALLEVERLDAELFRRTYFMWLGWEDPASRQRAIDAYVGSGWPDRRIDDQPLRRAAMEVLPALEMRVLMLSRRDIVTNAADAGLEIAQRLPGAKRLTLPGHAAPPELGDSDAVAAAMEEFDSARLSVVPRAITPAAFQTILFTDLESSAALTTRVGDDAAQGVIRGHDATVRAALEEHGGREVKHTGDGIMASFPSAVGAVTASLAIQRGLAGGEVRVRVGLNAGEPIAEDGDLFGQAVILAKRICDHAEPGQVLVSRVVADLCAGKGFEFASIGEATLKGFEEPVGLYEVGRRT